MNQKNTCQYTNTWKTMCIYIYIYVTLCIYVCKYQYPCKYRAIHVNLHIPVGPHNDIKKWEYIELWKCNLKYMHVHIFTEIAYAHVYVHIGEYVNIHAYIYRIFVTKAWG